MSEKIGIHHAFPPQEVSQQLRQRVSKAAEGHRAVAAQLFENLFQLIAQL